MSFHGLPKKGAERYERRVPEQLRRLLAEKLGSKSADWKATFQSRFGYADWLQPYTEPTLVELAGEGRRASTWSARDSCADCLETLEEIGIAAQRRFSAPPAAGPLPGDLPERIRRTGSARLRRSPDVPSRRATRRPRPSAAPADKRATAPRRPARRQRVAEEEALHLGALLRAQVFRLPRLLHALGDQADAERARERGDRLRRSPRPSGWWRCRARSSCRSSGCRSGSA